MTGRPDFVDRYREISAEITKLEAEKKRIRPKIMDELELSGGWDDCYLQPRVSLDYDEALILEWIKKDYPHLVDQATTPTLDWEKFKSLLNLQEIDILKMPAACEITSTTYAIMTKKRKKDEDN